MSITLTKKGTEHWDDLKEKDTPFKVKEKDAPKEKPEDPQESLMNMMKQMYDSGDDDMKRMISQSWSKAHAEQEKKKP